MDLATLQAQLNVAQLQLAALNAVYDSQVATAAANAAQSALQNSQNVARINTQIDTINSQITALQAPPTLTP